MTAALRIFRWLAASLLCLLGTARALNPNRMMSQYVREQWNADVRFPGGPVQALAQTPDGYLWIGSAKGLFRFDGFSFHHISSSNPLFQSDRILGLTTDDGGRLCVLFWGSSILCYRNGEVENLATSASRTAVQVSAMWREEQGQMLVYDGVGGILRVQKKNVEVLAPPTILPGSVLVVTMAETQDSKIWLGTPTAGVFYLSGGKATQPDAGLPDKKVNCLLPVGNELWVGSDRHLFHWNGSAFASVKLPAAVAGAQILTLLRDHNSNIWAGTTNGLLRINADGVAFSDEDDFGKGGINALLEDREGNLWVGGARGIERIRDEAFVTYSTTEDGRSIGDGPIFVDSSNRIWFAPAAGGMYLFNDGRLQQIKSDVLQKEVIYSIAGWKNEIWVGTQHDGLMRFEFGQGIEHLRTYKKADGLAENSVYSIYESQNGDVWAGTLTSGVSHLKDGRFTTYTSADGLASNAVSAILETRDGNMWFATANGLSSMSQGRWMTYASQDGLPSNNVNCLLEDSSGVLWIGTSKGLAFLQTGRVQIPRNVPGLLRDQILGMAEDNQRWLWIATSNHVLRVSRPDLSTGDLAPGDVREYGPSDGLPGTQGVRRNSSVLADSKGDIWFSLNSGVAGVDPSNLPGSSVPALVHIENVLADNDPVAMTGAVQIPHSRKRITFVYTGLSLSGPERIRFRYFLEGFDPDWSEPVETRQTVYTNLGPGSYRFRVLASNSEGLWNGAETSLPFQVEPALWETWWFVAIGTTAAITALYLLYLLRLKQVSQQVRGRMEARLGERERIARDLHDTLLQSVQGLILKFHAVATRMPGDETARQDIEKTLDHADQVLAEGRDRVRSLRTSTIGFGELPMAFQRVAEETAPGNGVSFKTVVEGSVLELHPVVRDESYSIGREALINALSHSEALHVEVEIAYDARQFRLRIRDDGRGIDPEVLKVGGRAGHWGLQGMRERARRIGGQLEFWSRAGAGTEIELTVPAATAYRTRRASPDGSWQRRLLAYLRAKKD